MPGIMINTIHEATIMKAWSPDWYHWFRFSVAMKDCQLTTSTRDNGSGSSAASFLEFSNTHQSHHQSPRLCH